jgi:hypothetical protein
MKLKFILPYIYIILAVVTFQHCSTPTINNDDSSVLDEYKLENKKLTNELSQKDSMLNVFVKNINTIEQTLSSITQAEGSIKRTLQTRENDSSAENSIIENIQYINSLLEINKKNIQHLNNQLKKSQIKQSELNKLITNLTEKLETKDKELEQLKKELINLNFKTEQLYFAIDSMEIINSMQKELIIYQHEELNTAFYCFGTTKELMNNGIINQEGGIIGIGKTQKIANDFNKDYFTKIDIEKIKKITLAAKKAKVISVHPTSSYEIVGEKAADYLQIIDEKEFWSTTKYLVISVE